MSEKTTALAKKQDEMNHLTVQEQADKLLEGFSTLDNAELVQISSEYLTLKENTTYNFIFKGMNKFSRDGKEVEVCEVINEEQKQFIIGNTTIVNKLKNVTQLPCFVRVVTKGMAKSAKGNYLMTDVYVIPQSVAK